MRTFTALFHLGQQGDVSAMSAAYDLVFGSLHARARSLLRRESKGDLQPTGLVSDAYLKLHGLRCRVADQRHFLCLASHVMGQVLIDRARARQTRNRAQEELVKAALSDASGSAAVTERDRAVRQVMDRLRAKDPAAAEALVLRYVEHMKVVEIARQQCREEWRVRRDIEFGLKWMRRRWHQEPRR